MRSNKVTTQYKLCSRCKKLIPLQRKTALCNECFKKERINYINTYGISNRKAASLLDTFSCVFQGIIPYGAQMLVAISAVNELGYEMSAFQILPVLFYPMMLLISSLIWIFIIPADR